MTHNIYYLLCPLFLYQKTGSFGLGCSCYSINIEGDNNVFGVRALVQSKVNIEQYVLQIFFFFFGTLLDLDAQCK